MSQPLKQRGADVGSGFQEAINRTNEAYEKAGIACITRKAIPGKYTMLRNAKRRGLALPDLDILTNIKFGGQISADLLQQTLRNQTGTDPRQFIPESRAEPDYGGCLAPNGRAIFYDAKSTRRNQLDFDNLHPHQVTFLNRTASMGAVSGFLVEFSLHRQVYFLPMQILENLRRKTLRKSVPYVFFEKYLTLVKKGKGLLIHNYLEAIREQESKYGQNFEQINII